MNIWQTIVSIYLASHVFLSLLIKCLIIKLDQINVSAVLFSLSLKCPWNQVDDDLQLAGLREPLQKHATCQDRRALLKLPKARSPKDYVCPVL